MLRFVTRPPKPLTGGPVLCHIESMKEILRSLPTRQLADLLEDLEVYGSTDEDWTIFEIGLAILRARPDMPQWAGYYEA